MGYSTAFSTYFLLLLLLTLPIYGKPVVPALFTFGDSSLDVGNNNNLPTIIKANFPPYGKDFVTHLPTGRFSNGKIVIDFASEALGFISYQPAYLNLYIKEGKYLLNGASFASAGSGYLDSTSKLYSSLSTSQQLECYKDYQEELVKIAGRSNALSIISGAIYLVGFGTCDFLLNYYLNPLLQNVYTPYQFSDILVQKYANFIQNLYALGARKFGVTTLIPIGCLPGTIFLFGSPREKCVVKINNVAIYFNQKLNSTSENLRKMLPGLNLAILDAYQPLYNIVTKPSEYGFSETRKGCFGTSLLENTSIFNNKKNIITICPDASKYVFWDGLHPTEAANKFLAAKLLADAISLIP